LLELTAKSDAILSRWGLILLPNPPSALARIKQMLVANDRLSAAVWSAPSKVPMLDLAFYAARKQIDAFTPPDGVLGTFTLADKELLKKLCRQA
jgi:hypothetical protein